MARYHITALNYINVGAKRAFFNFDSKLSYDIPGMAYLLSTENAWKDNPPDEEQENDLGDIRTESEYSVLSTEYISKEKENKPVSRENDKSNIMLSERQNIIDVLNSEEGSIIRLFKSTSTIEYERLLEKFIRNKTKLGNVYFTEFGPETSQFKNEIEAEDQFYVPIYDIVDTSIKSDSNLFGQPNSKIDAEDTYQNVFVPDMYENPIDFCQINVGKYVYTYMATRNTDKDPYMYQSQLKYQRLTRKNTSYYEILLESEKTNTLVYRTPYELGGFNTYKEYLEHGGNVLSIFEPVRNLRGIDRNYILGFKDSEISSEYDTGNIHAEIYPGKNPLNNMYSMEMNSTLSVKNSRRYCGINQSANLVYLKFYDSVDYESYKQAGGGALDYNSNRDERSRLPYQKIEFYNKNVFTNRCKHKSNLFSVKIEDLDMLSENNVQDEDEAITRVDYHPIVSDHAVRRIREDLYSAIKQIVENVCPVNTQLFKVYFGNG